MSALSIEPTTQKLPRYIPISHESVGKVACPHCGSIKGVPCKRRDQSWGKYCSTHTVRVRAWQKLGLNPWKNKAEELGQKFNQILKSNSHRINEPLVRIKMKRDAEKLGRDSYHKAVKLGYKASMKDWQNLVIENSGDWEAWGLK